METAGCWAWPVGGVTWPGGDGFPEDSETGPEVTGGGGAEDCAPEVWGQSRL